MKKATFILTAAIALSFVCAKLSHTKTKIKKLEKDNVAESRMEPNERMLLMRSYPDAEFDFIAYQNGQKQVYNANKMNKNNSRSLSWNVEGPGNIGGRFNCAVSVPGNSNIIYAGAPSGGIFKTIDGGTTWNPIFDNQPFLSVGCITIDPNNSSNIWVGTGDANISGTIYIGDGIYKSTDAGATWTNMGLNNQHVFSKIIIDPTNSSIIYAASMGQPFSRDNNRGLFKSTDGGATWNSILFISNDAGIIDMVMNPANTQVLYAASYNRIRNSFESETYGPQSKIWKSVNGGTTWTALTNGLPNFAVGRIGLTIYPSNPSILYTVIADSTSYFQGVYKTVNDGATWTSLNITGLNPNVYSGYGWYFGKIYVNPTNSNQIYVLGVSTYTTTNNGANWNQITNNQVHADHHWMDFISATTILLCTDGGMYKTTNNGGNWTDIENIPVNQVYHANENPFSITDYWCGVQDNGTSHGNALGINTWNKMYGADGFQPWTDPTDPNFIYAETQNGGIVYSDDAGNNFYDCTTGINNTDQRNWDMPYIISKYDHTILYTGTNQVYTMTGAPYGNWVSISPDLSDGLGMYRDDVHTITTISESPMNATILYAGTADANVWNTINGGTTWNNVTGTLPDRYITSVAASPNNVNNVYVAHSGYHDGDNIPHIHKSINNGTTWTDISGDLPQIGVNNILISQGNESNLYLATDAGVYYTINGGVNWIRLGNNMPIMPVLEIQFNQAKDKIIASAFARSVQTIDITDILSVGVNGIAGGSEIKIYPNPVVDYLQIEVNQSSQLTYSIYNLNGDLIKSGSKITSSIINIPFSDVSKGTYIINIENGNKKTVKKFIKL